MRWQYKGLTTPAEKLLTAVSWRGLRAVERTWEEDNMVAKKVHKRIGGSDFFKRRIGYYSTYHVTIEVDVTECLV